MKVVSVAPRSSRFSSCSLPRLRSQPIQRPSPSFQTRRRWSRRKRSPPGAGAVALVQPAMPAAAAASRASSPSTCSVAASTQSESRAKCRSPSGLARWWISSRSICSSIASRRGQQRRHGDERAQMRRECRRAVPSAGRSVAPKPRRHAAIDQCDRRVDRRDRTERAEQAQPCPIESRCGEREQRQGEQDARRRRRRRSHSRRCRAPGSSVRAKCAGGGRKPIAASNAPRRRRGDDSRDRSGGRPPRPRLHMRLAPLPGRRGARCRSPCGSSRAPAPRWRCDRDCASGNPCRESRCRPRVRRRPG